MGTPAAGERRAYRSERRQAQAAQTRAQVVEAATGLFSERGWAGTGMRDVAERAGVAVETVYAHFRAKPDLLLTAIDVGVVGDTEPVPLSQRPEFAALARGTRQERMAAAAHMLSTINHRSWGLRRAMAEAATGDSRLADKQQELERRRRDNIRTAAAVVVGHEVDDDQLDALWVAMNAETFVLLTQVRGRSVESYERWLVATMNRIVPER
jgi:AcrR family transcriptional regulator